MNEIRNYQIMRMFQIHNKMKYNVRSGTFAHIISFRHHNLWPEPKERPTKSLLTGRESNIRVMMEKQ